MTSSTTSKEISKVNALVDQLSKTSIPTSNGDQDPKVEEGEEEEEDQDQEEDPAQATNASTSANKKKKKKKSGAAKRKAKTSKQGLQQTDPPTIGLTKIFLDGCYPVGEIQQYDTEKFLDENRKRETQEELRERERIYQQEDGNDYNLVRRAAEVHRQVRRYARSFIKSGMSMTDIVNRIEDGTRNLVEANGFESGIGFPTGVSLNEVGAHFTPNKGDTRILQQGDVLKVDFGVHVKGRIVDSAFTLTFEDTWNPLLEAVRAATNEGIKQAGIDSNLGEIGAAIQEVMESHEFEALGKTHQVKCIRNLNGHNIKPYSIHGGKTVPIVKTNTSVRMEEGEHYAIETFGSTGNGYVVNSGECSHYARKTNYDKNTPLGVSSARSLLYTINKEFGSLPFCRRYLDRAGEKNYLLGLKHLVNAGIVRDYPPLSDIEGSMTAQFEHTIILRPTCKEVVSRGSEHDFDY